MSLRVAFMGTPAFAVPTLEAIVAAGHAVPLVLTRAPASQGRGLTFRPSAVGAAAERLGLAVETPGSLRGREGAASVLAADADVAVVVAYGMLLPPPVLAAPRLGCLNLHASLLPRWRGAAPIHRAVMAGDRQTGVAVMRMEEGLDTGPIGLERALPIGPDDTTGDLHDRLASLGAGLVVEALVRLEAGSLSFRPQSDEGVTYARKIGNEEARIDWSLPAGAVHDRIRGLSPAPGAFFEADLGRGSERVKVLRSAPAEGEGEPGTLLPGGLIACGSGAVRPLQVQRAGRAPAEADAFWRGLRLRPGHRFP